MSEVSELVALRIQEWLFREHDLIVSVQGIEVAASTPLSCQITEQSLSTRTPSTFTPTDLTTASAEGFRGGDAGDGARYRWIEKHADVEYTDEDGNGWIYSSADPELSALSERVDAALAQPSEGERA